MHVHRSNDGFGDAGQRVSGWFRWRVAAVLALMLGLVVAPGVGEAGRPSIDSTETGMVEVELGETKTVRLSLSAAPPPEVTVTLLSSDVEVVELSADGDVEDAADRVTLTFADSAYEQVSYTIHTVGGGSANIYQMMVMDDGAPPDFDRLQVEVTQSKRAGGITIRSTVEHPWYPLVFEEHIYQRFDHVFGETEHVTYEVSIDPNACPADVRIRGEMRSGWHAARYPSWRLGIVEGTEPPTSLPSIGTQPLDLTLSYSDCTNLAAKPITIYGLADDDKHSVYARLTHTLIRTVNGTETRAVGPQFTPFANDHWQTLLFYVPPKYEETDNPTRTPFQRMTLVNGVGPDNWAERTTSDPWPDGFDDVFVVAPRPPGTGTGRQWTELCVYMHTREASQAFTDDGERRVEGVNHRYKVFLPEITLVPATNPELYWWIGDNLEFTYYRPDPPDADGRLLPFEIERYSEIVNGGDQCLPASTASEGAWSLVYSGGPTVNTEAGIDEWRSGRKNTVTPFVVKSEDFGKFINIRIRGVYGVNPDSGYGYRTPSGRLNVKLLVDEIGGSWTHGTIVLSYGGQ